MSADPDATRPSGIPGVTEPGPFAVGAYAEKLRDELRKRARVQIFGEVWNLRITRVRVYFELRDTRGAVPCAMWRNAFDALHLPADVLADGTQVVVAGGPDYYVGGRAASPSFSFDVTGLRVAGEGDLLVKDFVKAIYATGYQGYLSLEIFNDQFRGGSSAAGW